MSALAGPTAHTGRGALGDGERSISSSPGGTRSTARQACGVLSGWPKQLAASQRALAGYLVSPLESNEIISIQYGRFVGAAAAIIIIIITSTIIISRRRDSAFYEFTWSRARSRQLEPARTERTGG